ncbi:MAG TPA: Wzz/FepE/Etk N-terminal domain-containing protein [Terriglobales bacterium]|nr:Wzz/FepE/Etk N-terminal domain-containing protein [Terriglobales bacterium]
MKVNAEKPPANTYDHSSKAEPESVMASTLNVLNSNQTETQAGQASAVLDLLIIVARRKYIVLWSTLLALVTAAALALLIPNRYTATTQILPPQQTRSMVASLMGQLAGLGPVAQLAQKDLGLKNPNDLYVGMLRSRSVEDSLIGRFDLLSVYKRRRVSDARRDLERASRIELKKEGLVSISVEDKDRRRAPQIANAYVEELRKLTQQLAINEAGQRRIFFEQQIKLAQGNLVEAEQALKETEQKTGVIQLDNQAKAIIESVVKLRAAIAAKEVELRAMRLSSTEQNPDLMLLEQQLYGMRAQLSRLEGRGNAPGNLQLPAGTVPEAGLEYVRKLRDLKYAEAIWELLAKEYEAARLDEAKSSSVIQVIDIAVEPDRKSFPPRSWIVGIAALLAFMGSTAYVLLAEAFHRLRSDPHNDRRLRAFKSAVFSYSRVAQ